MMLLLYNKLQLKDKELKDFFIEDSVELCRIERNVVVVVVVVVVVITWLHSIGWESPTFDKSTSRQQNHPFLKVMTLSSRHTLTK